MLNISGFPQIKTRVPLPLWCVALVVTIFSLSTALTQRDSDEGTYQQAKMASTFAALTR